MKVLVTGGAGFVGSNVARILKERGDEVFILDNFSHSTFKNIFDLDCEVICGDILDDDLYSRLPQVDAVINEAAVTDTTLLDDTKMMMVNFEGYKKVLSWCLEKKTRLVHASSAGVYGNGPTPMSETQAPAPLNTYAYSKYLCDCHLLKLAAENKDLPLAHVRYFNVFGPGEGHKHKSASMIYQLYLQMKQGRRPRLFKQGEQKRDHVYVKDVAAATVKALEVKEITIANVGTGQARDFNEIVAGLNTVMGLDLNAEYIDNPYTEAYQVLTHADISVLKNTLKYAPKYTLEQGIKDYVLNHLQVNV